MRPPFANSEHGLVYTDTRGRRLSGMPVVSRILLLVLIVSGVAAGCGGENHWERNASRPGHADLFAAVGDRASFIETYNKTFSLTGISCESAADGAAFWLDVQFTTLLMFEWGGGGAYPLDTLDTLPDLVEPVPLGVLQSYLLDRRNGLENFTGPYAMTWDRTLAEVTASADWMVENYCPEALLTPRLVRLPGS